MTADDLSTPLGQKTARKRRFRLPFSLMQAIAGVLGVLLLGFLGFALFADNPFGGEPMARAAINQPPASQVPDEKPVTDKTAPAVKPAESAAAANQRTITIIDGSSGQRRDVVVGKNEADNPDAPETAAAPATMAGIDPKLLEKSRYGMIPVAAGGLKPFNAYSETTDALRAKAAKMPVIAIVVGGLGVGAAKTTDAIMKLPGAVDARLHALWRGAGQAGRACPRATP